MALLVANKDVMEYPIPPTHLCLVPLKRTKVSTLCKGQADCCISGHLLACKDNPPQAGYYMVILDEERANIKSILAEDFESNIDRARHLTTDAEVSHCLSVRLTSSPKAKNLQDITGKAPPIPAKVSTSNEDSKLAAQVKQEPNGQDLTAILTTLKLMNNDILREKKKTSKLLHQIKERHNNECLEREKLEDYILGKLRRASTFDQDEHSRKQKQGRLGILAKLPTTLITQTPSRVDVKTP
eukprot:6493161-Ditylum_brightwellii.AAC.2